MPLDANSQTWVYDGTESASPFKTMLNLLANSVRDSINSVKASFSDTAQGAANWAYNSCFDIWQRGTSFTAVGWTADRWYLAARVATTMQRVTLAATDTFFQTKYAAQLLATAATNSATLVQPFASEDVAEMRGRQVVFAAKVQGLNAASAVTLSIQKSATADVASSGTWTTINSTTSTPGTAGSTVYVTATIPADSTASGVRIVISTNNNPNGYGINIGRVTFKAGTTAPVEHQRRGRTIDGEIVSCNRFYYRVSGASPNRTIAGSGYWQAPTVAGIIIPLPTKMRIIPTFAAPSLASLSVLRPGVAYYAPTAIAQAPETSENIVWLVLTMADNGAPAGIVAELSVTANTYIEVIAELP